MSSSSAPVLDSSALGVSLGSRNPARRSLRRLFAGLAFGIGALWFADAGFASATTDAIALANKLLKNCRKPNLDALKATLQADRKLFDEALDGLDAEIQAKTATIDDVFSIYSAAASIQIFVRDHFLAAVDAFTADMHAAVDVLETAGVGVKDWPKGFVYGDGGILDQFHDDFEALLDDNTLALEKRIRTTANLFEQKLGILVCFRLESPSRFADRLVHLGTENGFVPAPLSIDVAMTASRRDIPNDGRIYLGGGLSFSDGSAKLTRVDTHSFPTVIATVIPDVLDRWTYWNFTGHPEGNMVFSLQHPSDISGYATVSIGIR